MAQVVEHDSETKFVPGQLVDVVIKTSLHAEYRFPDMDAQEMVKLVRSFDTCRRQSQITLVNASGACLVIPTRVVSSVCILGSEGTPVMEVKIS